MAFQRLEFGQSIAGNDILATFLISLFSALHFPPFSPLLPFLIEGELGSKTYLVKVAYKKPWGTPLSRPHWPLTPGWSPTKDGHLLKEKEWSDQKTYLVKVA